MPTAVDLRNIPNYSVSEAAGYLMLSVDKLRSWLSSKHLPKPLIELPNSKTRQLSFINVVEAYVLSAISRERLISVNQLHTALNYTNEKFPKPHLLARNDFHDAVHLFVENLAQLQKLSDSKKEEMRKTINTFLKRIERDSDGIAIKLFLFTGQPHPDAPETVMIDPRISFGRPVLAGTGIPTAILAERYKAGESIDELADDYDCSRLQIEEGIRCELKVA